MKKWLKRIRGAVGLGLTWAAAWFGAGVIFLSGLLAFGTPPAGTGLAAVFFNSVLLAVGGFIGGAAFSVVLAITEGRRRFDQMSLPRFAAWGAVGGFLMSVLFMTNAPLTPTGAIMTAVLTLMGAGSAAGSLALARKADDGELLEAGESAGLIEGE